MHFLLGLTYFWLVGVILTAIHVLLRLWHYHGAGGDRSLNLPEDVSIADPWPECPACGCSSWTITSGYVASYEPMLGHCAACKQPLRIYAD
jgi:hypothetical protein